MGLTLNGITKFLSLTIKQTDWSNDSGKTYRNWKPTAAFKGSDQFLRNDQQILNSAIQGDSMLQRQQLECVHCQFSVLPCLQFANTCVAFSDNDFTSICFPHSVWFRLLPEGRKAKLQSDRFPIGELPVGMLISQSLKHHQLNLALNRAIAGIAIVHGQCIHATNRADHPSRWFFTSSRNTRAALASSGRMPSRRFAR